VTALECNFPAHAMNRIVSEVWAQQSAQVLLFFSSSLVCVTARRAGSQRA